MKVRPFVKKLSSLSILPIVILHVQQPAISQDRSLPSLEHTTFNGLQHDLGGQHWGRNVYGDIVTNTDMTDAGAGDRTADDTCKNGNRKTFGCAGLSYLVALRSGKISSDRYVVQYTYGEEDDLIHLGLGSPTCFDREGNLLSADSFPNYSDDYLTLRYWIHIHWLAPSPPRQPYPSGDEAYSVDCSLPPEQAIPLIISGNIDQDSNNRSAEIATRLKDLRDLYRGFQETYSEVQELQETIETEKRNIYTLEDRNTSIENDLGAILEEHIQAMCQAIDRRPLDTRPPHLCTDIPVDISSSFPTPSSRREFGLELINLSARLLRDTYTIVRTPTRVRKVLKDNEYVIEEYKQNKLEIDSKQIYINDTFERMTTLSQEAYYRFTSEIERRATATYDYNTDLTLSEAHNPVSILDYILNEVESHMQELSS